MDEKRLEREYRKWKRQTSPDLWERIDKNLKSHPERDAAAEEEKTENGSLAAYVTIPFSRGSMLFTAAAIILFFVVVWRNPQVLDSLRRGDRHVEETGFAGIAAETTADGEDSGMPGDREEVSYASHAGRLCVPEGAVTVSEQERYFSEAVLSDTELLFSGQVLGAGLEYDEGGRAVRISYELQIQQVYYAEDYISGMEQITVKSPIIKADSDEAYVLYQMKAESEYLLPVKKSEGEWELIYPFAPQVQRTADGAWQFHSGYASLVNDTALVIAGEQEGDNDFYYDRLLLREDSSFIPEFVALVRAYSSSR